MKRLTRIFRDFVERPAAASKAATAPQWHAWDPAPWDHPFLTAQNLSAMRRFSEEIVADLGRRLDAFPDARRRGLRFAFTGNMANNMYQRLRALSAHGTTPDLVQNPQDTGLMSDPRWEEFDGALPPGVDQLDESSLQYGAVHPLTGRVIATLTGPDGQRMRCNFQLADPEAGPQSGGMGDCELSTGERIEDATLRGQR